MRIALRVLIACIVLFTQTPITPASAQATSNSALSYKGRKLVWADEFTKNGRPSRRNWTYETGFVRNRELQWYQPNNAWCQDGLLIIEARRERKRNPNYDPNYNPKGSNWRAPRQYAEYTSASLMTKGLHAWKYGTFEMRARIDTRKGLWPSFWTLGVAGKWPRNGEIDILEYYLGALHANVWWGWVKKWDLSRKPIADFNDPNWSKKFHVWRMDWNAYRINIFVDDILLNTTELKNTYDGHGKNPLRKPHYLLLNMAVGGRNGGNSSNTTFPARFEVDYVRVYQ